MKFKSHINGIYLVPDKKRAAGSLGLFETIGFTRPKENSPNIRLPNAI